MPINIDLVKTYHLQKLLRKIRSIFDVLYTFAKKPLFCEKYEIKWNQTDRYAMGSFSQFKSTSIKGSHEEELKNEGMNVHEVQGCRAKKKLIILI